MTADDQHGLPAALFERVDESTDTGFYREPRFVAHIDQTTIDALTSFYREAIPAGADVLDLMSSWISHLPDDVTFGRVSGLGMNATELAHNPVLDDHLVHDLNVDPALPYPSATFDRILIAVSVQYLTRPFDVARSMLTTLKPSGEVYIAMSHRCFPTKAIAAFRQLSARERVQLVSAYLATSGFDDVRFIDRSPDVGDPLWIVAGTKPAP